jgi:type VI secretion system protein ImpB
MPKEGSVAPKERVNITYKPATGGAAAGVELPLKLMVLGDFTMREDETPLEERNPVSVDKDNFNDVLRSQDLALDLNVPNKLSGDPDEDMSVSLEFKHLNDFGPEAVAQQVPELKQLLELRDALKFLKGPLGNMPAFRKKIEQLLQDEDAKEQILKELKGGDGE